MGVNRMFVNYYIYDRDRRALRPIETLGPPDVAPVETVEGEL